MIILLCRYLHRMEARVKNELFHNTNCVCIGSLCAHAKLPSHKMALHNKGVCRRRKIWI